MKKTITPFHGRVILLLLLLFLGIGRLSASVKIDGIYYELDSRTLTASVTEVYSGNTNYAGNISIPENIIYDEKKYSVTSIGGYAFWYCTDLTSITIPNSVTSIGERAFLNCTGLTSITIPNSVTSIGDNAFERCTGLTSLIIPNSVTSIGVEAFYYCIGLTSLTISSSITSISYGAFSCCKSLTSITIPNSVTSIENFAFNGCEGLTSIVIPESVTSIGEYAFSSCKALPSITIPYLVTNIGNYAFRGCESLTFITIPEAVASLGEEAFSECPNLFAISFKAPQPVSNIYNCFQPYKCPSLNVICVPKGCAETYEKCYPLNNYIITESSFVGSIGSIYYSVKEEKWTAEFLCPSNKTAKSLTIPATIELNGTPYPVSSIANKAFNGSKDLKEINMKANTPPIADPSLFDACSSLTTIYVPLGALEAYNCEPWNHLRLEEFNPLSPLIAELEKIITVMPAGEADFSNHGVIQSAAQLSTNKPGDQNIASLVDNDVETYFQSTTNTNNSSVDNYHYLEVDMGTTIQTFWLKHYRRNHTDNAEPKTIRVFATNDKSGEWTEIGVTALAAATGADLIELGAPYRYVRFVVEETFGGSIANNNLFFAWSELGIWNARSIPAANVTNYTGQLLVEARADVENGMYSEKTYQRLLLMRDLYAMGHFSKVENMDIDYTGEYSHTQWQALYLPFDIPYDEISKDFTVAELNNFHQYDDDNDGTFDRTELEVLHLKPGAVIAHNTPYVIRAKETGTHKISLKNATLYDTPATTADCSSLKTRYFFHGTFCGVSGADMFSQQYYAMADGALCQANTSEAGLGAFRWYMSMESRNGGSPAPMPARIQIVEKEDNATTDIHEANVESLVNGPVYNLNGQRVGCAAQLHSLPKGVYVVNGKKVLR